MNPKPFGSICPHCGLALVPPVAHVRADGRVVCKARRQTERETWITRRRVTHTLRREQAS